MQFATVTDVTFSPTFSPHLNTALLVSCPFAREIWLGVLRPLAWHSLTPCSNSFSLADWWASARKKLLKSERRDFDSMVLLVSWLLWLERNRRVFDRQSRSAQQLLNLIADEAFQWSLAGYKQVAALATALGRPLGRAIESVT